MAENIKEAQSCLRELNKKHEKIVNKLLDIEKYKRVGIVRIMVQNLIKDRKYVEYQIANIEKNNYGI